MLKTHYFKEFLKDPVRNILLVNGWRSFRPIRATYSWNIRWAYILSGKRIMAHEEYQWLPSWTLESHTLPWGVQKSMQWNLKQGFFGIKTFPSNDIRVLKTIVTRLVEGTNRWNHRFKGNSMKTLGHRSLRRSQGNLEPLIQISAIKTIWKEEI